MFFTTYKFVFLFLPVTLLVFLALLRRNRADLGLLWLMACSMVFFASLDSLGLAVICGSVVANYFISALICRWRAGHPSGAYWALFTGVSLNIALLGHLKYFAAWFDAQPQLVPLGISFYSLMQIAYLVNTYAESPIHPAFPKYFLYITFFPYVVAGPILTRKEHLDQFDGLSLERCRALFLSGLFAFAIGLVKKVGIADSLAPYVSAIYSGVSEGVVPSSADAWAGALMYALQLYFDFSGYSDMAAGLAAMFGIRVMRNFHSPLKAVSMIEFWSRWHISMSRFFRDHVFMMIAIRTMRLTLKHRITGLSRYALTTLGPMIVTFLLIGIWHGAGANFVVFGVLMGVAVSVNHMWRKLSLPRLPAWLGWLLTMMVFVVALVFNRSRSFGDATVLLGAMVGHGADPAGAMIDHFEAWLLVTVLGVVVTTAPNTHELLARYPIVLEESALDGAKPEKPRLSWAPTTTGVVVAGLMLAAGIALITKANEFIYYRF